MRADIHDGWEHTLQSEAGYIDARPHRQDRGNLLHRTAGPYIRVTSSHYRTATSSAASPQSADIIRARAMQETMTRKTGRLGGVFQPPNRADILRLTYSKISEIGITAKACLGNSISADLLPVLPHLYSDPPEAFREHSSIFHPFLLGRTSA